jgi:hypothetical protein
LWLFVVLFEDRFIYFPTRHPEPAGAWETARLPFPCEDVWLTAADGVKIHGWHARGDGARWTLLYLHGNAGNIAGRAGMIQRMTRLPADVLAIDYRGYGRSEGAPSEAGLYADARAAYDWLVGERRVDPGRIVLYGESLGTAPAAELAAQLPVGRIVLQSPFTRIRDMAGRVVPLLPVHWFMRHRYDTFSKVARVRAPVLVIHSPDDEVIPFEQGRRVFEAAPEPKQFYEAAGGGHNDLVEFEGERFWDRLRAFLGEPAP